ncbi:MAG: archaeal proteasome endopeptidase complex subunit beta [Candidatus Aenigmarchaeota archaeon]|nr:archaeal proteasome endopeptidase complex subunit beta [Candidatus Aenigmarchaeota archaeon]
MEDDKIIKTGTTTVGMVCKDGILLASESKATAGYMVVNKDVQKVFEIDDKIGITIAGMVSDAQQLINILRAEISLHKLESGEEMSINSVANLLSTVMYSRRMFPYYTQIIIGGMDSKGAHLFSFDPTGSCIKEKFVSTGSGSPYVYGILEKDFKEGMTLEEAKKLVRIAIKSAAQRDIASGGEKIWLAEITEKGFKLNEEKLK